jgi:large subunit ribosomal protein L7/L12
MEQFNWPALIVEIGDQVAALSVAKAAQLIDYLETTYGIEPLGLSGLRPLPQPDAIVPQPTPEPTEFSVLLEAYEVPAKIAVIRAVRAQLGLGLKEARDLVDRTPTVVRDAMPKADAEKLKAALEEAGARVAIQPMTR